MKKIASFILVFVMIFSVIAVAASAEDKEVLVFGTSADYAPFEFMYPDENGTFLSYYNTTGWSKTYSVSECLPELEFFMYNGDNMALVQFKDDNKFGIEHFNMHVMIDGDYRGTFETTDEPTYIRADFFQVDREYLLYIVGVDANGNEITQMNSVWVMTMGGPTDLKVEKTGDRKYLFSWNENAGGRDGYNLAFYTDDGEFETFE